MNFQIQDNGIKLIIDSNFLMSFKMVNQFYILTLNFFPNRPLPPKGGGGSKNEMTKMCITICVN